MRGVAGSSICHPQILPIERRWSVKPPRTSPIQTPNLKPHFLAGWGKVPFYVVGEATAASLNHTFSEFEDLGLGVVDVRGQLSGNAAILSSFILDDLTIRPAKLLYLTGDKNRDTLSKALEGGGLTLHSIQVYRTEGSPTFEKDLASVLASSSKGTSDSCLHDTAY